MQPDRMSIESVKYTFTRTELLELGAQLAQAAEHVYEIERQKAEAAARIGAELKRANLNVGAIAEKVRCGYEMRDMECRVLFDQPRAGMKSVMRPDTGEVVREEAMNQAEMQRSFKFPEAETKQ